MNRTMGCVSCGHFRKLHLDGDYGCQFKGCPCMDYDPGRYRCSLCSREFTKLDAYDQHKLTAWNTGKCPA